MENRKNQHIAYALQFHSKQNKEWEQIHLPISSFPEIALSEIDISTTIMGMKLSSPFFINGMTGGSKRAEKLNRELAIIAQECNLMVATGSYSIALKHPKAIDSFAVFRKQAPDIKLGVNLGADKPVKDVLRAVEEMEADFLQIHVNSIQEMIMPEGERDFRGWLKNIQLIREKIDIPVMVKQVGFGMSGEDIEKLINIGIKTIDISGKGGTNFARIENARRDIPWQYLENLGVSTIESLKNSMPYQNQVEIIASGGIKNPLHIAKALALGAKAVGIAGHILFLLENKGLDQTIDVIKQWQEELKLLYLACGVKNTKEFNRLNSVKVGYDEKLK